MFLLRLSLPDLPPALYQALTILLVYVWMYNKAALILFCFFTLLISGRTREGGSTEGPPLSSGIVCWQRSLADIFCVRNPNKTLVSFNEVIFL